MLDSNFTQPAPELLAEFVKGNPVAQFEVVNLIYPQLYRWAVSRYHNLPESEVESVVNQAMAETCRRGRYNPVANTLFTTYVIQLIEWRMADLYKKEQPIRNWEVFDLDPNENANVLPYNTMEGEATRLTREGFFQEVEALLDKVERELLHLMLQGEKRREAFAAVLVRHDTVQNPTRDVENAKARLTRKLRTIARERGYHIEDLVDQ